MVMTLSLSLSHTHTHKISQVKGESDRVETNGQTDGQTDATNCFTFPANAVGNKSNRSQRTSFPVTRFEVVSAATIKI